MTLNGPMTRLNRVATLGSQSADQFGAAVARTGVAASPLRPAEAVDHLGRPVTCGLAPVGGNKAAPLTRPVQRIGRIVSHALVGGLHHRYVRI